MLARRAQRVRGGWQNGTMAVISTHRSSRILVVADDLLQREYARSSLTTAGHEVEDAGNGVEAIEKLNRADFDLAITDLTMPELDGFELLEHIRLHRRYGSLPVIVTTNTDNFANIEKAHAMGATSFIAKPINWSLFGHQVQSVIEMSRREAQIRIARDAAESASRMKSNILSVVTHEFRTPLHQLVGFSDLLAKELKTIQGSEKCAEFAGHVRAASQGLDRLLSDLLLYARAMSQDHELDESAANPIEIVSDALGSCREKIAQRQIEVVERHGPLDDCNLSCDRRLLVRALSHLIENAVRYSPEGSQLLLGAQIARDGSLLLSVKDDGPGIDRERLAVFFEPLAQGDMSHSRRSEGMGLGLAIAKAAAEAHGGQLLIEPFPASGTLAAIILPSSRLSQTEAATRAPAVA